MITEGWQPSCRLPSEEPPGVPEERKERRTRRRVEQVAGAVCLCGRPLAGGDRDLQLLRLVLCEAETHSRQHSSMKNAVAEAT